LILNSEEGDGRTNTNQFVVFSFLIFIPLTAAIMLVNYNLLLEKMLFALIINIKKHFN